MIVDSHVHAWSDDGQYPFEPSLKHNMSGSVELLNQTMAESGIDKAVIVQPIHYLYDNQYVRDCLRRFRGKFAGVALVNPKDPSAPDRLEELVKVDGFGGIRLHFSRQKDPMVLTQEDQYPLWQRVQDLAATITVLVRGCEQLPIVEKMVKHFPEVKVVIDHMAFLDAREKSPYPTFSNLLRLAKYPNIFVKVSNLVLCSHEPYPHRDVFPFIRMLYSAFGPERLMWASDWPLVTVREVGGYLAALELVRSHIEFLSPSDREWLFNKTVRKVWSFGT
jgi:L-fuconolactonase